MKKIVMLLSLFFILLFGYEYHGYADERPVTGEPPTGLPWLQLLLLNGSSQGSGQISADWELVTNNAQFSPRDTAEGVVFDGKMWLSNGWSQVGIPQRDLWHSINGVTWTLALETAPYDAWAEMVVYQNKIWAVKESVWSSSDGTTWTQILDKTPFGVRNYGELVVLHDKMWQLGSGSDVWNTTDGMNWVQILAEAPFGQRGGSAVVAFNGKLWLMGGATPNQALPALLSGRDFDGKLWLMGSATPKQALPALGSYRDFIGYPVGYPTFTALNDVWCSDDGVNWVRIIEKAPWSPRWWSVATVYAGKLWIMGGYDNERNLGDVWYTENGSTWFELKSKNIFTPRHESTPYVYNGSMWVAAGNAWPVQNDVWRLTIPSSAPIQ